MQYAHSEVDRSLKILNVNNMKDIKCNQCIEEENKRPGKAKFICNRCGFTVCIKHEKENCGECPMCPPPMFEKL